MEPIKRRDGVLVQGEVESLVKQIGKRVKVTGAQWRIENAP
jgi:hypothetical protein